MSLIDYKPASAVPVDDVEPGDQVLTSQGYRVVYDITIDNGMYRFHFWDDEPILRRPDSRIRAKRRVES